MNFIKSFTIIILTLGISASLSAQNLYNDPDALYDKFRLMTERWRLAYNSMNADNLLPFYTEDAAYVSSHVAGLEAAGRDKIISNFQNGMDMGGYIDNVQIIKMEASCNMATLYCSYKATNNGITVAGRNLLVMQNINDEWLIILHMTVV